MKPDLNNHHVFLSASFPSGVRARAFPPADPAAVTDAVTAVARAVLGANGRLVFGGHPTITPLVLLVAASRGSQNRVDVFQSQWFEHEIPEETLRLEELGFGRIHWTGAGASLAASLQTMREEMFTQAQPVGAVFIGGMEGILDEWELFTRLAAGRPRLPVATPGGAAAQLVEQSDLPPELAAELSSPHYPALARRLVEHLALA